ncbi:MAG: metallophosphoesterase family protein [Pseudomonadota bacterium]
MRAYGVGDIHGRLDLLDAILRQIGADLRDRPVARSFVVFLGDYIDRGPDSSGVLDRLSQLQADDIEAVFLMGNHEEILLDVLDAKPALLEAWLKFGGSECAASYGVDVARLANLDEARGADLLARHIPARHIAFLRSLGDTFRFGDFVFVHAGIRPGVWLEEQVSRDLRWIREPFLSDPRRHDQVVVHGHTITEGTDDRGNRIGIDTGAYRTGILTAVAIEPDGSRRFLST